MGVRRRVWVPHSATAYTEDDGAVVLAATAEVPGRVTILVCAGRLETCERLARNRRADAVWVPEPHTGCPPGWLPSPKKPICVKPLTPRGVPSWARSLLHDSEPHRDGGGQP